LENESRSIYSISFRYSQSFTAWIKTNRNGMTADFGFNDGTTKDRVPKEQLDAVRDWAKKEMEAAGLQNYLLYAKKTTAVPGKQPKKRKPTEDVGNWTAGHSQQRLPTTNQPGYQGYMPPELYFDYSVDGGSRIAGRSRSSSPEADAGGKRRRM
jgi:hypothetical protein